MYCILDACEPGTWSLTGVPPCVECDVGFYESNYGSTVCKQCPGNRITLMEKSDNVSFCVGKDLEISDIYCIDFLCFFYVLLR